jgi:hypothetical protein
VVVAGRDVGLHVLLRSITVSAPQSVAHRSFSTPLRSDDDTAEVPMLALIFTRKWRPIIGSSSRWRIADRAVRIQSRMDVK